MTCLFCKIATGETPAKLLFEDNEFVAFDDIDPKAPCHILIIPRKHIATINDLHENDTHLIGKMFFIAKNLAKEKEIADVGYRLVMNCNRAAGQAVYHIHLHLLGGRKMQWPPG